MAGIEREFLEMLPPRDRDHRYLEADHSMMRDFWRSTSDRESLQLQEMRESGGRSGHSTMPDMHEPPHSLGPYNYNHDHLQQQDTNTMQVTSHHDGGSFFTEYHPYHLNSNATSSGLLPTYTNFFHAACVEHPDHLADHRQLGDHQHVDHQHGGQLKHEPEETTARCYMTSPETHDHFQHGQQLAVGPQFHGHSERLVPVGIPVGHDVTFSTTTASESINRDQDLESLRRELAYKCPRSSDLLIAITRTAETAVREHCSGTSGVSSDDDDAPDDLNPNLADHEQDVRAAIIDHPYYPEMVVSHIKIFKIGAPRDLRIKLDEITKKFQRFQERTSIRIGDDPSLDFFMRSYVDLLTKLGEDLEEPFTKFMQFKDATTKSLENICGHYIETGPDETDNYGYDIGPRDGAQDSDELDIDGASMYPYADVDESIVVDPSAPDDELKKLLMMKYGRHIGGLKAEFNRVRKKGKLPPNARSILKDWFNRHSYWPYPSEVEKQYLQRICSLNLKQINNWFINERKRHWSCEGKCMHPNAKFYTTSSDGKIHLEHME